jgi:hypothetical protein
MDKPPLSRYVPVVAARPRQGVDAPDSPPSASPSPTRSTHLGDGRVGGSVHLGATSREAAMRQTIVGAASHDGDTDSLASYRDGDFDRLPSHLIPSPPRPGLFGGSSSGLVRGFLTRRRNGAQIPEMSLAPPAQPPLAHQAKLAKAIQKNVAPFFYKLDAQDAEFWGNVASEAHAPEFLKLLQGLNRSSYAMKNSSRGFLDDTLTVLQREPALRQVFFEACASLRFLPKAAHGVNTSLIVLEQANRAVAVFKEITQIENLRQLPAQEHPSCQVSSMAHCAHRLINLAVDEMRTDRLDAAAGAAFSALGAPTKGSVSDMRWEARELVDKALGARLTVQATFALGYGRIPASALGAVAQMTPQENPVAVGHFEAILAAYAKLDAVTVRDSLVEWPPVKGLLSSPESCTALGLPWVATDSLETRAEQLMLLTGVTYELQHLRDIANQRRLLLGRHGCTDRTLHPDRQRIPKPYFHRLPVEQEAAFWFTGAQRLRVCAQIQHAKTSDAFFKREAPLCGFLNDARNEKLDKHLRDAASLSKIRNLIAASMTDPQDDAEVDHAVRGLLSTHSIHTDKRCFDDPYYVRGADMPDSHAGAVTLALKSPFFDTLHGLTDRA